MKKTFSFLALGLVAGLAIVSCQKEAADVNINAQLSKEIVFKANATKATAVTALTTFNVLATKGATETSQEFNIAFNKVGETTTYTGATPQYWITPDPTYHFYASNAAITYAAQASTVVVTDNATDVVCAKALAPTYLSSNTLTFDHIFARIGTITINTQTGYELSDVSATVKYATSGTWNLYTDKWSAHAAEAATPVAAFSGNTAAQTSTNDVYVVPATSYTAAGTNQLSVTYTLTKGAYTITQTKTANLPLQIGKINNITATVDGGDASEIEFIITVNPWTANDMVEGTDFNWD